MTLDIHKLRGLLVAEQQAESARLAHPGNEDSLARACNLTGSLTEAALDALPELLAIAEAAGNYVDAERRKNRYSATQYHALFAAVDAARKETP